MIKELTGQYRFLSNFWSCFIDWEGDRYPSVENAYQAAKCRKSSDRHQFVSIKASEAKRLGQVIEMNPVWESMKLDVMYELVKQKFTEPRLKQMLLETGDEDIQEGNWWGDRFWGTVNGVGANHLGKILMRVRSELNG